MAPLETEIRRLGITKLLQSEWLYYRDDIDREETKPTFNEFVDEWQDRHETDRSVGWLDAASVKLINQAYVNLSTAVPRDSFEFYIGRTWFRLGGICYVENL